MAGALRFPSHPHNWWNLIYGELTHGPQMSARVGRYICNSLSSPKEQCTLGAESTRWNAAHVARACSGMKAKNLNSTNSSSFSIPSSSQPKKVNGHHIRPFLPISHLTHPHFFYFYPTVKKQEKKRSWSSLITDTRGEGISHTTCAHHPHSFPVSRR
jgi:hypothetical protein